MEFEATYLVLGNLQIRYYGIIIVLALLAGAYVASLLAARSGRDSDHIWGGLTWAIIPGIIGARLWFILFPPISLVAGCGIEGEVCQDTAWFLENFFDRENGAIAIWTGGLGIFGGMLGAALGVYLYLSQWHNRIIGLFTTILTPLLWLLQLLNWLVDKVIGIAQGKDLPSFSYQRPASTFPDGGMRMAPWLDIAAVSIPLGQAIGRFANYVNQELYGTPTNLPWGIQIPREARVAPFESLIDYPVDTLFHPIWAYEAIWSLVAFYVLWRIYHQYRDRLLSGDILLLYIAQYSFVRLLLEFLRVEIAVIGGTGINSSQAITLIGLALSVGLLIYRHRSADFAAAKAADDAAEREEAPSTAT
ncbi:MAG: prolipoprotein diacylglyceryl transferase [Chloroflexota bacterium]|nr:prolipoprotein diacylglyceryl transferase [Chloroflexota bacterium]MDE2945890.1 prolipoprotein diacylglyceryl transferase [Chloroflexota bacterium]